METLKIYKGSNISLGKEINTDRFTYEASHFAGKGTV